jgi:hypothetical protein
MRTLLVQIARANFNPLLCRFPFFSLASNILTYAHLYCVGLNIPLLRRSIIIGGSHRIVPIFKIHNSYLRLQEPCSASPKLHMRANNQEVSLLILHTPHPTQPLFAGTPTRREERQWTSTLVRWYANSSVAPVRSTYYNPQETTCLRIYILHPRKSKLHFFHLRSDSAPSPPIYLSPLLPYLDQPFQQY